MARSRRFSSERPLFRAPRRGGPGVPVPEADGASPAISARGITKVFPGVVANDEVSFEAARGEVHALLGENGAGKTTLCNILTGLYRPDGGELAVYGRPAHFHSPKDAHEAGIFMVHQHFRLVDRMTVAENVVLGWSRRGRLWFAPGRVEEEVAAVAQQYGLAVDTGARIWQLSVGERQRVEILKALYRGARILILDEPTTVLTPQESEQLFASLRQMAAEGSTVVFISHKLPEVTAVCHRVTVLRKGRSTGTVGTAETDARSLARMMVGRDVVLARKSEPPPETAGAPVLELSGVSAEGDRGGLALRDVSLTVQAGEILGVAGVAGNGQRELAEVVAGLRPRAAGSIRVEGRELRAQSARRAIEAGIAYIPEDRLGVGVAGGLNIAENSILKSYRQPAFSLGPILRSGRVLAQARDVMERFDVRAPGPGTLARELSGGNVQRVMLGRELSSSPKVLVASAPTAGLDVASTDSVRTLLVDATRSGVGVLLITEDLGEILDLADRIAVMYEGRVVGVVPADGVDVETLGLMMGGAAE